MSTLRVNTLQNTSGVEVYTCKAWVNFNGTGTSSPFTIANGFIRAAGNVTSVTDNGVGDYTVNFTNAMVDANYCVSGSAGGIGGTSSNGGVALCLPSSGTPIKSTTQVQISTFIGGTGSTDRPQVSVAIYR
jgi:hypothetical protein